jgi:hypothetical protein
LQTSNLPNFSIHSISESPGAIHLLPLNQQTPTNGTPPKQIKNMAPVDDSFYKDDDEWAKLLAPMKQRPDQIENCKSEILIVFTKLLCCFSCSATIDVY